MSLISVLNKNKKRIVTGTLMGILALLGVTSGGLAIAALVWIITFFGANEYVKILNNKGFYPFLSVIVAINSILIVIATFKRFDLMAPIIAFGTICTFMVVLFRGKQPYIANVATTILGFIYCGWLPCHIILLRQLDSTSLGFFTFNANRGLGFILMLFFVILATDIGAYYFGSKFGKTPLCSVVSPKKTVEGALGGAVCAIITALAIGFVINLEWYYALTAGLLMTLFAQIGDLAESLIKRDAGVKDSGNSLPGHGGFLDRADSFIFTAPIAYYFFKFFVVTNTAWADFNNFIQNGLRLLGL